VHVYSLPHITTTHTAGLADAPVFLPMKKRPYFISFIGRWTKNAIRMELAHLHSRARPLGLKNVFLNSGYPVKKLQHGNAARNQTTGTDETQAVLGKSRSRPSFGAGGIPVLFRPLHGYKPPASLSKHKPPVPLKKDCHALELLSVPNASSLVATQLPCLWRPPHQESIPFASYGIALDNATSLLTDLIAISRAQVLVRRPWSVAHRCWSVERGRRFVHLPTARRTFCPWGTFSLLK
jgi:hypothetical protein